MGVFDKAIPNYVINDGGRVVVTQPEPTPYIDDIFDPVFNKAVRDSLLAQSNGSFGKAMARGYWELLKNTFEGHNDRWGVFGPGMGILSTFGRSMDKADDFILGAATEAVKGISGQGATNPIKNIFQNDYDYTGKGFLAALTNVASPLAGGAKVDESDFGGLWNVPAMAVEFATDPGIMGGAVSRRLLPKTAQKASAKELLSNLGNANAKTAVGTAARLLSDYDDIMSRIAIDATAPGLRPLIKRFGASLKHAIGPESARGIADAPLNRKEEVAKAFSEDAADTAAEAGEATAKFTDAPVDVPAGAAKATTEAVPTDVGATMPSPPSVSDPTVVEALRGELERQQMKAMGDGRLHFGAVDPAAAETYDTAFTEGATALSEKSRTFEAESTKRLLEDTAGVESNIREWLKSHNAQSPVYNYSDVDTDLLKDAIDEVLESYTKKGELPPTWLLEWSRDPSVVDAKTLFEGLEYGASDATSGAISTASGGYQDLLDKLQGNNTGTTTPNATHAKSMHDTVRASVIQRVRNKYYNRLEQQASQMLQLRTSIYRRPEVMLNAADNIQNAMDVSITELLKHGASYDPAADDIAEKVSNTLNEAFPQETLNRLVSTKSGIETGTPGKDASRVAGYVGAPINDTTGEVEKYSMGSLGFSTDDFDREYAEPTSNLFTTNDIVEPLRTLLDPSRSGVEGAKEITTAANNYHKPVTELLDSIGFNDWVYRTNPLTELNEAKAPLYDMLERFSAGDFDRRLPEILQTIKTFTRNDTKAQQIVDQLINLIPKATDNQTTVVQKLYAFQEFWTENAESVRKLLDTDRVSKKLSIDFGSAYKAVEEMSTAFNEGYAKAIETRVIDSEFKKSLSAVSRWLDDSAQASVQRILSNGIQTDEDVALLEHVADAAQDAFDKLNTLAFLKSVDDRLIPFLNLTPDFTGDTALMELIKNDVIPSFRSVQDIGDFMAQASKSYPSGDTVVSPSFEFIPTDEVPSQVYKDVVAPARDILQQVYGPQAERLERTYKTAYQKAYEDSLKKLSTVTYPNGKPMYTPEELEAAARRVANKSANTAVSNYFNAQIWGKEFTYNGEKRVFDGEFLKELRKSDPATYRIIDGLVDRYKLKPGKPYAAMKGFSLETLHELRDLAEGKSLDPTSPTMLIVRDAYKTKLNNYVSWREFEDHAFHNVPVETDRVLRTMLPSLNYKSSTIRLPGDVSDLRAQAPAKLQTRTGVVDIPPLDMHGVPKIEGFAGQFRFLDPTYPAPITVNGRTFLNAEAAYQALKHPDHADAFTTLDGKAARLYGASLKKSVEPTGRVSDYMLDVLRERYKDPMFRQRLIDTYPNSLVNIGSGTDSFWGLDLATGKGKNRLGGMLEQVRHEVMLEDLTTRLLDRPDILQDALYNEGFDIQDAMRRLGAPYIGANVKHDKQLTEMFNGAISAAFEHTVDGTVQASEMSDALTEIAQTSSEKFSDAIMPEHAATVAETQGRAAASEATQAAQDFVAQMSVDPEVAEAAKRAGMNLEDAGENLPYTVHKLVSDQVVARQTARAGKSHILETESVKKIVGDVDHLKIHDPVGYQRLEKMLQLTDNAAGDIVRGSNLMSQLITSDGVLAIPADKASKSCIESLTRNVKKINEMLGTDAVILETVEGTIRVRLNHANRKAVSPLLKHMKELLKEGTLEDVAFVEPNEKALATLEKARAAYPDLDALQKRWAAAQTEYYKMLGFSFDNADSYIPHVRRVNPIIATQLDSTVYKGLSVKDRADLAEMAQTILQNSQELRAIDRGSLGSVLYGRRLRGTLGTYDNFADGINVFKTDPLEIFTGSFSEGTLHNSEFQTFVELTTNDNYKIKNYFRTPDELKRVLTAQLPDGTMSGNSAHLAVASPRYNAAGKLTGFKIYDTNTSKGLEQALADENSILCARSVISKLDAMCKKEARMSHAWFRAVSKLTTPFKLGCLINPGFLLGNFSDAAMKQAVTMADKYGTSVTEELSNLARAYVDVMDLNNRFSEAFDKYIADLEKMKILTDEDRVYSSLLQSEHSRKLFNDYAASVRIGSPLTVGTTKFKPTLQVNDIDLMQVWMYLNGHLPTMQDNLQDLGDTVGKAAQHTGKYEPRNILEKILYGTWSDKSDKMTWGVISNNPLMRGGMNGSEDIERVARATSVLNDMRHNGMPIEELEKVISEVAGNSRADEAVKARIKLEEALGAMNAANFNYDNVGDILNGATYAMPFPTFYLKNIAYWLDLLERNPRMIKNLLKAQNAMWDSTEEEEDDRFVAEAKGRGSLAFGDVDSKRPLKKFFKGIYKPTPLQSMFSAFDALQNPVESLTSRVNPLFTAPIGAVAGKTQSADSELTALLGGTDTVKYRPYNTKRFQRNVRAGDKNFSGLRYMFHRMNPFDRAINTALRIPEKAQHGELAISDIAPSVFQPRFK